MKKKVIAIMLALTVLCSLFAMQTVGVVAEEVAPIDDNLRVWFDFRDECFLGRDGVIYDAALLERALAGIEPEFLLGGTMQDDVTVVTGLNGNTLSFTGSNAYYNRDTEMIWSESGFYIQSETDLLPDDNTTINIVFQNEIVNQLQPIFCAGFDESNYLALMSACPSLNAGAGMVLKSNGNEQTILAPVEAVPEAGTWNMLTYVQEDTVCKLYLNGNVIAETELQHKLSDINCERASDGTHIYSLGAHTAFENTPGFKGLIDDFRIYGSALTQEEIQALATSLNIEVDTEEEDNGDGSEGTDSNTPSDGVVIDWDFSDADSVKDVVLGNGVTIENGKATFAPGNAGIALPDDIFKDAEKVTIEMVMQPSAFENNRTFLSAGNKDGNWVVFAVMKDGALRYSIITDGKDNGGQKAGNSTDVDGNYNNSSYRSGATLTTDKEYAVKYEITKNETNVYIDGELAITIDTEGENVIGSIGGPVALGKATKWPDSSFEGTISSFKVTLGEVTEDNNPSDDNPSDDNPSDNNPSDDNPSDDNPSYDNPSDDNPSDDNPSDDNPSDDNPNDDNPSDDNPSNDDDKDDDSTTGDNTPSDDDEITGSDDKKDETTGDKNDASSNEKNESTDNNKNDSTTKDENGSAGNNKNDSSNVGTQDSSTESSKTGDVASVAAILAAGVAALGGLKLRKKVK